MAIQVCSTNSCTTQVSAQQPVVVCREAWQRFGSDVLAAEKASMMAEKGFAFAFVEGALVRAVREGWWLLLDEINLAPAEVCHLLPSMAFLCLPWVAFYCLPVSAIVALYRLPVSAICGLLLPSCVCHLLPFVTFICLPYVFTAL